MAPRKQPIRLEQSVLEFVADKCANAVKGHLENCNAAEVEPYITCVQNEVCDNIPPALFNDFAVMFLQRIFEMKDLNMNTWHRSIEHWLKNHGTAMVDVIVHDRLTKLELYPGVPHQLMYALFSEMHRLRNLRDLIYLHFEMGEIKISNFENCNLENLTTFGCHYTCTDEVLQLISERCPNLTTLDIRWSRRITSAGLGFLRRCARLRMVNVEECHIQTNDLINNLLGHDVIENIAHFIHDRENLMRFEGGVYPQLTSLHIYEVEINEAALGVIVKSFPSLDTLFLNNQITGDLRLLRSLPLLTSLSIWHCPHSHAPFEYPMYAMRQVSSLLSEVGRNYSSLSLIVAGSQLQQVVNLIYETCKNITYIKVAVFAGDVSSTITIPPFENLESLSLKISRGRKDSIHLQFTRLLALKKLHLHACCADLKSILLDHDNFPCIGEIREETYIFHQSEEIRRTIRENNFDVCYDMMPMRFFNR